MLQPLVWSTCLRTSSCAENPERGMGGHVAWSVKGDRCSPGQITFWERTAVCSRTSPSGIPGTTWTTSWFLGVSVVPPNGRIPSNKVSAGSPPYDLRNIKTRRIGGSMTYGRQHPNRPPGINIRTIGYLRRCGGLIMIKCRYDGSPSRTSATSGSWVGRCG